MGRAGWMHRHQRAEFLIAGCAALTDVGTRDHRQKGVISADDHCFIGRGRLGGRGDCGEAFLEGQPEFRSG